MKEFLASKSLIFHLIMLYRGVDLFPTTKQLEPSFSVQRSTYGKNIKKKILIVGMSESPHLHTWIEGIEESQIVNQIWLFPSDFPVRKHTNKAISIKEFPYMLFGKLTNVTFRGLDALTNRLWRSLFLFYEIKRIKPTHLHFHETQHGAYIYNAIARHPKNKFQGKLILSTWGSDLIVYGRTQSHQSRVKEVMSWVNLLTSERIEDLPIAKSNGFTGKFLAPTYITVGNRNFDFDSAKTSERTLVLIKGYQDNHGRALNALASIELLASEIDLNRFKFRVFSASESVSLKTELLRSEFGIDIEVLPRMPKATLMKYFGEARVYIGLAISDGLSTSMVEAMSHGAFPIQSKNSSAPEFLENSVTGGVVDPWNIPEIAKILKNALLDDELVINAARINLETLRSKYDWEIGLSSLVEIYD